MTTTYEAGHLKRARATKAEMVERREHLLTIAEAHQPASVRHLYYLAVVNGVAGITKNDSGYNKVQRLLVDMRMEGVIPFNWIVDSTRWMRRPPSWDGVEECLNETARLYRRDLWSHGSELVEVWCESDSIAGVIADVTYRWNVPLMVTRGFSPITFARNAFESWANDWRPVTVYYIGDHDPHGLDIEQALLGYFDQWGQRPGWQRLGVTWDQVERYNLPGTKPKRDYGYPLAVEAEAMPPDILRDILDRAIHAHVDPFLLERHEIIEAEERTLLRRLARLEVAP